MTVDGVGLEGRLVLASLATWRLTHLLSAEDGPWHVVVRVRRLLGSSFAGQLMDCFYCLSLWIAAPLSLTVAKRRQDAVLAWLALSGAACLIERLTGEEPSQPAAPVALRANESVWRRTTAGALAL